MRSRMTIFNGKEVRVLTERHISDTTGDPFWMTNIRIFEEGKLAPGVFIDVYMDDETSDQMEQAYQDSQTSKEAAA